MNNRCKKKKINYKAIYLNPTILLIALHLNVVNTPIKRQRMSDWTQLNAVKWNEKYFNLIKWKQKLEFVACS